MQSGWTKFQFQKRIEELEEELIAEKMVKKNEKQYNEQLRVEIEKRDLHIQALNKINDHFSDIIAKLRKKLKDSINEI
jgi:phage regulator Rha-like protein|tara:strand:+ start:3432 stop:3665 length:234 start_codon:yes stop_codon:yes gene_type:complete